MSSRKILIAAIVILLVVVCVGLYFLLLTPKAPAVSGNGSQTGQPGALPNTASQSIPPTAATSTAAQVFGVALNQPALDYFVTATGTITAIQPNGTIIQSANGQISTISALLMQNILSASFSYDGTKILVSFGNPTDPQASIFNIDTKEWVPLASGLQSPVWSPSDYRIGYYAINQTQGTETLTTLDTSKSKPSPVALVTLHAQDLATTWPVKNQMILYTKPSAYVAGSAWMFNLQNSALTAVAIETPGLEMLWGGNALAPATSMGLEFSSGGNATGGSIALTDSLGNVVQQLKFLTLPSKCLFASSTSTSYLYCGVPRDSNTLSYSHLPDDYNQMALFTSDDIYRINLQNGAITTIFNDQSQNMDISDIKLFNNTLFLVNRYDQKLYAIQL